MLQVVEEARRDPAEHGLPLLPLHVLLQLDEAVGHRVEGVAELAEFVLAVDRDARIELALGDRSRAALKREDRRDELAAEERARDDHDQQRRRGSRGELPAQAFATLA